jgi:hypothetical protein
MKKKYFIILLLIMIFPINVLAYEISCGTGKYQYGDTFSCYISGIEGTKEYDSLSGTFTIPDTLTCSLDKAKCGFNGTTEGTSFNLTGTTCGKSDFVLNCKVSKEIKEDTTAQITVDNFKYKLDGKESSEKLRSNLINLVKKEETTTTTTTKNRSILNGNSLLKSVTSNDIDFTFSKYITEYDIQVLYSVKEVNFTYEKNLSSAKVTLAATDSVTMNGNNVNVLLDDVGTKSFDLIVTSDDGGETVYTFNVERLDKGEGLYNRITDATLSKLELGNYNLNFDPKVLNYTLKVDSSVDTISVSATPNVEGATVSVHNNTDIKNGTNIIIAVTALDKTTTQNYVITIKKSVDYTLVINGFIIAGGAILILFLVLRLVKVMNHKSKDDPIYKYKIQQKKNKMNSVNTQINTNSVPSNVNNTNNNQSNL